MNSAQEDRQEGTDTLGREALASAATRPVKGALIRLSGGWPVKGHNRYWCSLSGGQWGSLVLACIYQTKRSVARLR